MDDRHPEKGQPWGPEVWAPLVAWLQGAYPLEGCGLILEDWEGRSRFLGCQNLADIYHERDPLRYPRGAADFYILDPRELMWAEARGERAVAIVHSHPDGGADLSEADIAAALMPRNSPQEPVEALHPGVDYLILSIHQGQAQEAKLFYFEPSRGEFLLRWHLQTDVLRGAIIGKGAAGASGAYIRRGPR